MTKEQHQEFIEYALEIKWNRDHYSRAWIIEHLMDKIEEINNRNKKIPTESEVKTTLEKLLGESLQCENSVEVAFWEKIFLQGWKRELLK